MVDDRIRRLERAAALGDAEARAELSRERTRRAAGEVFPPWAELLARAPDPLLPANLGDEAAWYLANELGPLQGRAEQALAFVLAGDHAEVLTALAEDTAAGRVLDLKLSEHPGAGRDRPPRWFLERLSAPALARLGVLFLAAVHPESATRAGPLPRWLEAVLWEASDARPRVWSSGRKRCALSFEAAAAALTFAGEDPAALVAVALRANTRGAHGHPVEQVVEELGGLNRALFRDHVEAVREALLDGPAERRATVIQMLVTVDTPLDPWWDALASCATCTAAAVRLPARALMASGRAPARAAIERVAREGSAGERERAVPVLEDLARGDERILSRVRALLGQLASRDRSRKVREAASLALAQLPQGHEHGGGGPPPADLPEPGPEARAALAAGLQVPISDEAWARIASRAPWTEPPPPLLAHALPELPGAVSEHLAPFAAEADVTAAHVLRALCLLAPLVAWERDDLTRGLFAAADGLLGASLELAGRPRDLEELAGACAAAALDPRALGRLALEPRAFLRPFSAQEGWEVAAYYARDPQPLVEALGSGLSAAVGSWGSSLLSELDAVLAACDPLPAAVIPPLLSLSLGGHKRGRELAQRALDRAGPPDLDDRLLTSLASRRQDERIEAARWLATRRPRGVRAALEAALSRERQPRAQRALRDALRGLDR
ncbi:MAG: hypothetical protein AB7N76_09120 [Planctomycetota bacterium]